MKANQKESEEYFNIENYDTRETFPGEEMKNQYSTFIEELEETTEKLMNQVFNKQYKPEIEDQQELIHRHQQRLKKLSGTGLSYTKDLKTNHNFKSFLLRNQKWQEMKDHHIKREKKRKDDYEQRSLKNVPTILRGSVEKFDPIYERGLDIHREKQKKLAFKRINEKKVQQQNYREFSFHPEINENKRIKDRSLNEYLKDKQEWERKKKESREVKKIRKEAQKYTECVFTPKLVSKQILDNTRIREGELVEDRLLRSLEKMIKNE